jgi:hypothetical protein
VERDEDPECWPVRVDVPDHGSGEVAKVFDGEQGNATALVALHGGGLPAVIGDGLQPGFVAGPRDLGVIAPTDDIAPNVQHRP